VNVATKLAGFAFLLLVALGVGAGIGAAVGPLGDAGGTPRHVMTQGTPTRDVRR